MSYSMIESSRRDEFKFETVFENISTFKRDTYTTVYSDVITCGDSCWKVCFSPNGTSAICRNSVISLEYVGDEEAVLASYTVSVKRSDESYRNQATIETVNAVTKHLFSSAKNQVNAECREARNLTLDKLQDKRRMYCTEDGKLRLIVELIVFTPAEKQYKQNKINRWWDDISAMVTSSATADVVLKVGDASIPAHRMILGIKSKVFRAMFDSHMQESSSNEVVITDFSEAVVRSMLRCLYDPSCIDAELATTPAWPEALLTIADKYEVCDLAELVEQHMVDSLTSESAIGVLLFADTHGRSALKTAALDEVVRSRATVLLTPNLPSILGESLCGDLFAWLATNCGVKSNKAPNASMSAIYARKPNQDLDPFSFHFAPQPPVETSYANTHYEDNSSGYGDYEDHTEDYG